MAVPETVDQPSSELQDQQPVEPVKPPADNDTILLPGPTPDDRPSDAEILLQQNEIRAEVAKLPYVGPKEPMDSLKKEYESGSEVFLHKVERLEHKYSHLRRTRGDGNCWYRAFIFGYLEDLILTGDAQEANRLSSVLQGWKQKLVDTGFQELVFEDAMDLLIEQLSGIAQGFVSVDALESAYQEDTASNLVVLLLRLIVSGEVRRREDFFFPFILGTYDDPPSSVESFCTRYVEPMAEESDNIHIVALTDALEVPVTVVYLDRSGAAALSGPGGSDAELDVTIHEIVPENCQAGSAANMRVHVLYRPGHYDILYRRQPEASA